MTRIRTRHWSPLLLLLANAAAAQDSVTVGLTNVGPDSFRFGQYNGLRESGTVWQAAIAAGRRGNYNERTSRFWQLSGERLGLRNGELQFEFGAIGRDKLALSVQGLPSFRFDGPVETPFNNVGNTRLNLPANWSAGTTTKAFSGLQTALQSTTLHTDRQHLRLQSEWRPADDWTLNLDYQHQRKRGLDALGAAFGSNGGNTRAVLLASPVDYDTDNFSVTLEQLQGRNSWRLGYEASLFSNANRATDWANPFNNPQWRAGANFSNGAYGAIAQAPDNHYQQLSFSRVQTVGDSTTLTASFATGRMRQDEVLLPYSAVFVASTPLPTDQLQGSIHTYNSALSLQSRLSASWSLRLRYTLDGRDNDVQRSLWLRIPNDAAQQATPASDQARVNRPYSHVKQKWDAQATWRLPHAQQLQFGYQFDRKQRDFLDVDEVDERTASVVWSTPLPLTGRLRIEGEQSARRGNGYAGNTGFLAGHSPDYVSTLTGAALFENDPLLRRFHIADRDRTRWQGTWTQPFGTAWSLTLQASTSRDRFPASQIGVQRVEATQFNLTLGYAPTRQLSTYVWWGQQQFRNRQQGYARGGAAPAPVLPVSARLAGSNWWMSTRDSVDSAGAGIEWQLQPVPLALKLEADYSDASSSYLPASSGQAWQPFPAVGTRSGNLLLSAEYTLPNRHRLGLRYRYVDYTSSDFALDNVAVDTLNNVLLLGATSPIFSGSVVELRFTALLP